MSHRSFLAVCVLAAMSLSSCESVQSDLNRSYADIRQTFSNFRPFDTPPAQQQRDPEDDLSPVTTLADDAGESTPPKNERLAIVSTASSSGCPLVRIVQDLNQVHQFVDVTSPSPSQSISSVRMQGVDSKCDTVKNNIAIDMTVAFEGNLGPKARARAGDKPSFAYPYFVAITNNQGSIVAKEVFAVTLAYDGGKNHETHTEQIRQLIPLKDKDYKNYKVLVGFQLTDEELAFNRALPSVSAASIEPASGY